MSEHIADVSKMVACPFCGADWRYLLVPEAKGEWWVICDKCKASAGMANSRAAAIAAWNQRAGDVDLERAEAEITRLQAAITTRDAEYRDIVIELGDKQAELTALRLQVATATSGVEAQSLTLKASEAELTALRALREAVRAAKGNTYELTDDYIGLDYGDWNDITDRLAACDEASAATADEGD